MTPLKSDLKKAALANIDVGSTHHIGACSAVTLYDGARITSAQVANDRCVIVHYADGPTLTLYFGAGADLIAAMESAFQDWHQERAADDKHFGTGYFIDDEPDEHDVDPDENSSAALGIEGR